MKMKKKEMFAHYSDDDLLLSSTNIETCTLYVITTMLFRNDHDILFGFNHLMS